MACAGAALYSEPSVCRQLSNTGNAASGGGKGPISAGMGLWPSVLTCSPYQRPAQKPKIAKDVIHACLESHCDLP